VADVARRRSLFLKSSIAIAVVGSWLAIGCRPPNDGTIIGSSTAAQSHGSATTDSDGGNIDAKRAHAFESLGLPSDFRTSFKKLNRDRIRSNNHAAGRYEVDVYANEAAAQSIANPAAAASASAIFVADHIEMHAKDAPASATHENESGPIYVMIKMARGSDTSHHDWRYEVADGSLDHVDTNAARCSTCHDEAPHDAVFRIE
jgi:hypothetical protein